MGRKTEGFYAFSFLPRFSFLQGYRLATLKRSRPAVVFHVGAEIPSIFPLHPDSFPAIKKKTPAAIERLLRI
jgi:hypothetical protein